MRRERSRWRASESDGKDPTSTLFSMLFVSLSSVLIGVFVYLTAVRPPSVAKSEEARQSVAQRFPGWHDHSETTFIWPFSRWRRANDVHFHIDADASERTLISAPSTELITQHGELRPIALEALQRIPHGRPGRLIIQTAGPAHNALSQYQRGLETLSAVSRFMFDTRSALNVEFSFKSSDEANEARTDFILSLGNDHGAP